MTGVAEGNKESPSAKYCPDREDNEHHIAVTVPGLAKHADTCKNQTDYWNSPWIQEAQRQRAERYRSEPIKHGDP